MAETRSGISGLGTAMAASGAFLMYAGIRDVPLLEGIRELLRGQIPQGNPQAQTQVAWDVGAAAGDAAVAGAAILFPAPLNDEIVQAASQYVDRVRYKFGGAQSPQVGMDCSGLVNWVLGHDLGLILPGASAPGFDGRAHGPITTDYLGWVGAVDVKRGAIRPGDLLCGTGHIAIAIDANNCIDSPTFGQLVHRTSISWSLTPVVRRVRTQDTPAPGKVKAQ